MLRWLTCERIDLHPLKPLHTINLSPDVGEDVKGFIMATYKLLYRTLDF